MKLDELLVAGGDERLELDAEGRNKYHLDPRSRAGTLHRGSCTCSPISDGGRRAASSALDALQSGITTSTGVADVQRRRLLDLFAPSSDDRTGVIFAPSGSDLCYLPLLFSSVLDPGRRIVNVVATSEELGSGSLLAHDGRFFAERSQIDDLAKGDHVSSDLDIESVFLPARDERGAIVDQADQIERLIGRRNDGDVLVVNLVIGSKSGIENGVRIIERFGADDITWTVDLCQMRARPALFERLLGLGCMLLCTGSKFYEAPPFCGAMLVPAPWMHRLAAATTQPPSGFGRIFSSCDFPTSLARLADTFPDVDNLGLRLRWEAALHEMEAFVSVPEADSAAAIAAWSDCVVARIRRSRGLELLRDEGRTNDSIVSFRVSDGHGGHLDHGDLAEIHRRLAVDGGAEIAPYERALIGQPVASPSGSFLRVAIGSCDARVAAAAGFDPAMDLALIAAIERVAGEVR